MASVQGIFADLFASGFVTSAEMESVERERVVYFTFTRSRKRIVGHGPTPEFGRALDGPQAL